MKATVLYKIASVLLSLFAAGHTFGFLSFNPPFAEGRAVYDSMNNVHFKVKGSIFSYGGFYRGFGLSITANMLFSAFLAWYLGALAGRNPERTVALGWALCAVQVVILSWIYFSAVPAMFSATVAVCLGWAAWLATGA
jgi:hypothetical protein